MLAFAISRLPITVMATSVFSERVMSPSACWLGEIAWCSPMYDAVPPAVWRGMVSEPSRGIERAPALRTTVALRRSSMNSVENFGGTIAPPSTKVDCPSAFVSMAIRLTFFAATLRTRA